MEGWLPGRRDTKVEAGRGPVYRDGLSTEMVCLQRHKERMVEREAMQKENRTVKLNVFGPKWI